MKKINLDIAKRIRSLRKKFAFTQAELASRAGVDYKHVQRLEGKAPNDVKISNLQKIAKAFNMSLSKFLDF